MKLNPITIILVVLFVYPVLKGFLFMFSSQSLKRDVQQITGNVAFIAALFLGVYFSKKLFVQHDEGIYKSFYEMLPQGMTSFIEVTPTILYFIIIPIVIGIIYKALDFILEALNKVTFYTIADSIEDMLKSSSAFFKRIVGAVFQLPRSICYVLFAAFILNFISIFNVSPKINKYLETSKPYEFVCKEVVIPIANSTVAKQLPNVINNSFKVVVKETPGEVTNGAAETGRTIIYYNGVTLEEGVKSNKEIDSFARQLVLKDSTDRAKAKRVYVWVGSNITYDNEKANAVMNNDFDIKSGAIPTYNTRKGICFDYACLYVAMVRANGMKVRLVTGEGFNGVSWVSHAWNEVYLADENKWVNVDPTFYQGGAYFDSTRFNKDHRNAKVVGQW